MKIPERSDKNLFDSPWGLVATLGAVSLLADFDYEGGRSLLGPFMGWLGATPFAVAAVAGAGELIGYGLRLLSGRLADKTKKYWTIAFTGYALNLLSGPLLSLCGNWKTAAMLLMAERAGKGIRNPVRDTLLSFAAEKTGRPGFALGVHDAMDKLGAVIGPVCVALIFHLSRNYSISFGSLLVPAAAALWLLGKTASRYRNPSNVTPARSARVQLAWIPASAGMTSCFWYGVAAAALLGAGTADFPFMAQRLQSAVGISAAVIPVLYAAAMGSAAISSLGLSRLFDRFGIRSLALPAMIGASAVPFIFLGHDMVAAVAGCLLWGASLGAQEPIMKAHVTNTVSASHRATGFGRFWATYGLAWFAGSVILGAASQHLSILITFAVAAHVAALPFIWRAARSKSD